MQQGNSKPYGRRMTKIHSSSLGYTFLELTAADDRWHTLSEVSDSRRVEFSRFSKRAQNGRKSLCVQTQRVCQIQCWRPTDERFSRGRPSPLAPPSRSNPIALQVGAGEAFRAAGLVSRLRSGEGKRGKRTKQQLSRNRVKR